MRRNGSDVRLWFRGTDGVIRGLGFYPADQVCPTWKHDDEMEMIVQIFEPTREEERVAKEKAEYHRLRAIYGDRK